MLERKLGDEQAKRLFTRYADAFPEGYKDGHTPYEALKDLAKLELLEEPGQLEMHLFRKQPPRANGSRTGNDRKPDDGTASGSRSTGTASRWCSPPCCRCCTPSVCG